MAVIGFNQLDRSASGKQTTALLQDLQSMIAEYEAQAGGLDSLGLSGPVPNSGIFPYVGGVGTAPTVTSVATGTEGITSASWTDRMSSALIGMGRWP